MSVKHLFVDTNILVYAHDLAAGEKHSKADSLVEALWDRPYPPAISTQVPQELYVSLTKKGASGEECRRILEIYFDWEIVDHDASFVREAMDRREEFQLSFWNSLIVASAQRAKVAELWSEDFQEGQKFGGVTVINPLRGKIL